MTGADRGFVNSKLVKISHVKVNIISDLAPLCPSPPHSGPKSGGRRTLTIFLKCLVKLKQKINFDTYDAIMIIFLRLFRAYSLKKWVKNGK